MAKLFIKAASTDTMHAYGQRCFNLTKLNAWAHHRRQGVHRWLHHQGHTPGVYMMASTTTQALPKVTKVPAKCPKQMILASYREPMGGSVEGLRRGKQLRVPQLLRLRVASCLMGVAIAVHARHEDGGAIATRHTSQMRSVPTTDLKQDSGKKRQ
jgi:hypothetical protein